jgi:hypothetical protein
MARLTAIADRVGERPWRRGVRPQAHADRQHRPPLLLYVLRGDIRHSSPRR